MKNGFVQIPVILVIILMSGGIVGVYKISRSEVFNSPAREEPIEEERDNPVKFGDLLEETSSPSPSPIKGTPNLSSTPTQETKSAPTAPSPLPSPTPTSTTSSTTPTSGNASNNSKSSVTSGLYLAKLNSISPGSGIFGQEITLRGSNFDPQGYVSFYSAANQNSGGAPIISWTDTEIKAKVPFVAGGQTYYIEVQSGNGNKSERRAFFVTAGQPIIDSITPSNIKPGNKIFINGTAFGEQGTVNFYAPGDYSNPLTAATVTDWSDSRIIAIIPTSLTAGEYGIDVTTSDGRRASVKFYNVGY